VAAIFFKTERYPGNGREHMSKSVFFFLVRFDWPSFVPLCRWCVCVWWDAWSLYRGQRAQWGGPDGGSVAGVEFFAVCEKEKRFIV